MSSSPLCTVEKDVKTDELRIVNESIFRTVSITVEEVLGHLKPYEGGYISWA